MTVDIRNWDTVYGTKSVPPCSNCTTPKRRSTEASQTAMKVYVNYILILFYILAASSCTHGNETVTANHHNYYVAAT